MLPFFLFVVVVFLGPAFGVGRIAAGDTYTSPESGSVDLGDFSTGIWVEPPVEVDGKTKTSVQT